MPPPRTGSGKTALDLSGLETLMLDEADRMLDIGFQAAMEAIIAEAPARRQLRQR